MERGEFRLVEFKATEGSDQPGGLFAALVSVFGTKDRVGDRVMPGAFTKTLDAWKLKNKPIPVIWSHSHMDPESYIGTVDPADVRETKDGLIVAGQLDINSDDAQVAARARRIFSLLKRGLIDNWSFAYQATKARVAKDGAREISEVDLFEIGPTLVGAHPGTKTLALKAMDLDVDLDALAEEIAETKDWNASAAMASCSTAADFRSICAGEKSEGDPDTQAHWALPHHNSPGAPFNPDGVVAARRRFNQTQGLANKAAARTHLFETHRLPSDEKDVDPESKVAAIVADEFAAYETRIGALIGEKVGKRISKMTGAEIQRAIEALTALLAEDDVIPDAVPVEREQLESTTEETLEATSEEDSEETAPDGRTLIRASLANVDSYLLERNRR